MRPKIALQTLAGIALAGVLWLTGASVAVAEHALRTTPDGRTPSVDLTPRQLSAQESGIGKRVPDTPLAGIEGTTHSLYEQNGAHGTVVVVRDPACPVSRRYGPRIAKLANHFGRQGFSFVFIYPSLDLGHGQRVDDARKLAVDGVYAERGSFALAEHLGVKSTGDVFLLDRYGDIRYRGAVDDQFGLGYTRDAPTSHYLRNALEDLQAGRPVRIPATAAPGCHIDADPAFDLQMPQLQAGHLLS
ncbi:MAG: hypothetical protein KDI88_12535 [Gammaproteobacteria bacterium]|nr:hypothetical protein [Gammaproteobacteria bacterium]